MTETQTASKLTQSLPYTSLSFQKHHLTLFLSSFIEMDKLVLKQRRFNLYINLEDGTPNWASLNDKETMMDDTPW